MKPYNLLEGLSTFDSLATPPGIIKAVATALIGPEGGVVRVTDPDSPIAGTTLKIPAGALDNHELIQIEEGGHDCAFGIGPSVNITPEGLRFNHPAQLDMRFHSRMLASDELEPAFYVYDRTHDDWHQKDESAIEPESGVARCRIWHL